MNDINSVFRFYRMNLKKKIDLYNRGIDTFDKINYVDTLSSTQKNQMTAFHEDSPVINIDKIAHDVGVAVHLPPSFVVAQTIVLPIVPIALQPPTQILQLEVAWRVGLSPSATPHQQYCSDARNEAR